MNTRFPALAACFSRATASLRTFFKRATQEASDGLEAYLSTATSLHQLEDMQRRWDRHQAGTPTRGAF